MILAAGGLTVCGMAVVEIVAYLGLAMPAPGWLAVPLAVVMFLAVAVSRKFHRP
jgi:hypothetical protein